MAEKAEYIYRIVDEYSSKIAKITAKTRKFDSQVKRNQKSLALMSRKMKTVGTASARMGRSMMMKTTVPITALGTAAVISFARMETGLINVNNLLSRDELPKFKDKLDAMQDSAVRAGFSIDDANKGLFDTISALGASERSFDAFTVGQKLAIGGATDLGIAVDGLTTIMNVYKKEGVSATEAANAFFSAQVKGKTTVAELSANIGVVAPIARAAGVGYKELLAAMSALSAGGISTDQSATALKGAISALINPAGQAELAMRKMNIVYGSKAIKEKGLTEVLRSLAKAQEKFGVDAITKAIPNIRALTAVTAMTEENLQLMSDTINKINDDMKTGDGLMRAFADQNNSMAKKFARAKGQMTVAFKRFVVLFAPAINSMLDKVAGLTNKFSKLSKTTKIYIIAGLALAAILPPLLIGFGMLTMAISALLPVIGMLSWPLVAIGAAIGVLIYALVRSYQESAMFRQSLVNLAVAFSPVIDGIREVFNLLSGGTLGDSSAEFRTWGDEVAVVINFIAEMIKTLFAWVGDLGTALGALSMGNFGDAFDAFMYGSGNGQPAMAGIPTELTQGEMFGAGGIGDVGKQAATNKEKRGVQKHETNLTGMIDVTASGGAKVNKAEFPELNTGSNGASRGF